jgi:hypothetical protein
MVQGRTRTAGQPAGGGHGPPAAGDRHLAGAPLDRHRRDAARTRATGAGGAVHRAPRPCRDHRGPRFRPASAVGQAHVRRRRPAVAAGSDRRGPHRIHGNGPHAQPTRTGGRGRRARLRHRTQHGHVRLAPHRSRARRRRARRGRPPGPRSGRPRPLRGRPRRRAGDRVAGAVRGSLPGLGRLPGRRPPAQGGGRPAERGRRHALLPPSSPPPAAVVGGGGQPRRPGRVDVPRRRPGAHRAEVLRDRRARRARGR